MTTPMMWHEIAAIEGYTLNVPDKKLWIKPNLPKSMKGELHAPLLGSICWGDLDYSEVESDNDQHLTIKYDRPMQFDKIYVKEEGNCSVAVYKGGKTVSATIGDIGDEYEISFRPTLSVDTIPVDIYVGVERKSKIDLD